MVQKVPVEGFGWLGRGDQTGGSKNATEIWLAARGSGFFSMVFECFESFYILFLLQFQIWSKLVF